MFQIEANMSNGEKLQKESIYIKEEIHLKGVQYTN